MNRPSRKLESTLRIGVELPELLHRHVLLGARERAGQCDVERVLQDLSRLLRAGLALDHLVEGALHVEHHRVERALVSRAGRAGRGHARHRAGRVVELLDPHRLGQAPGGVDGEDDDAASPLGGTQRQRRRRRRLADATGAAAHDDPGLRVVEQAVDVQGAGGAH
jgi:hypothetical protein